MAKQIEIQSKGETFYALVDESDYVLLGQKTWFLDKNGYAVCSNWDKEQKKQLPQLKMHRLINQTPKGYDTDHINGNRLDNRRENLRTLTHGANCYYHGLRSDNTSGVTGVRWHKIARKWQAEYWHNKNHIYLGLFQDKQAAIEARREALSTTKKN